MLKLEKENETEKGEERDRKEKLREKKEEEDRWRDDFNVEGRDRKRRTGEVSDRSATNTWKDAHPGSDLEDTASSRSELRGRRIYSDPVQLHPPTLAT